MKVLHQNIGVVVLMLLSTSGWGQSSGAWKPLEIDSIHGVIHVARRTVAPYPIALGNENIRAIYESCSRAPIAVVANHTSIIGEGREQSAIHLVDTLLALGLNVRKVFAPEHGFRGDSHNGAHIEDEKDAKTGLDIFSLHGKNRKPDPESLSDVRMIIFDIQDVGARFYTYLSTLFMVMEAAAELGKVVVVLDRPNPHGHQLAGPIVEPEWISFVGQIPVPVLHGMTLGEMARMINGEGWLSEGRHCELIVIPCEGYAHSDRWFPSIPPSPNLRSDESIALYPSLCPFESTVVSVGRGTSTPFECIGWPGNQIGSFAFTPESDRVAAPNPKHQGELCIGQNLTGLAQVWMEESHGFDWQLIHQYAREFQRIHPSKSFVEAPSSLARLTGSEEFFEVLSSSQYPTSYPISWIAALVEFDKKRRPYLLYPMQR